MRLSFYAKGATTGKISSHLAAVYDARVSKNVISNATGTVGEKMQTERARPLERVYGALFLATVAQRHIIHRIPVSFRYPG